MKLLRFEKQQQYITYDWETANLELASTDIQCPWQLGVVKSIGNKIHSHDEYWMNFPRVVEIMNLWGREAAKITGWTQEEFERRAQDYLPVMRSFVKDLYNPANIIITANGYNFDNYMTDIAVRLCNGKLNQTHNNRHVDIQCVEKAAHFKIPFPLVGTKEWAALMLKMSETKEKGLKTSLAYLCSKYKVDYDPARHHKEGSYDALLTFQIYLAQIGQFNIGI